MKHFRRNFLLTLFLCTLASLVALARFDYTLTGIDDANIYFVYAKNVANGYGFVYNVGGERVEGFTSFLWTVISALVFKLSNHPETVLLVINIALLSLGIAIALTYLQSEFLGQKKSPQKRVIYSTLFLAVLLTSPRYMVWNTVTLMENSLWSTLLLMTTIFVIKDHTSSRAINLGLTPLLIVLALTRPEAYLWATVFMGVLFVRAASTKNVIAAGKELAPSISSLIAAIALSTLFRWQYFGYPLPNTFYAKVSPSFLYNLRQGTGYLSKYLISDPVVFFSVITIVVSAVRALPGIFSRRIADKGTGFLPFIATTGLLTPLLTGGDHFGSFRLYQNVYPIQILCLIYFVDRILPGLFESAKPLHRFLWKRTEFKFGSALLLMVIFLSFQIQMWQSIKSEINIEFIVADYGRKNGAFIQKLFLPLSQLPSLGVVTSGGIKYSYEGEVIDLMGLNNTIMAHNGGDRRGIKNHAAFDIPTFYRLQPAIIWPLTVIEKNWQYSKSAIKESWENREGLKGLFDEPNFLELYAYAKVSCNTSNGYALVGWFQKDLLEELRIDADFHVEEYQYTPNKP